MNLILAIIDSLRWDYFLGAEIPEVLDPAEIILCKSSFPSTSIAVPILLTGSGDPRMRSFAITTESGDKAHITQILEPTIIDDFEAGIYINVTKDETLLEGCSQTLFPGLPNGRCLREFLQEVSGARWCAVVHIWDVHYPYGLPIPEGKAAMMKWYNQHRELGLQTAYGRAVSRLREERIPELMKLARDQDALLVLTSDHGELLGENGRLFHGPPAIPQLEEVPLAFWPAKEASIDYNAVEQYTVRDMILMRLQEEPQ